MGYEIGFDERQQHQQDRPDGANPNCHCHSAEEIISSAHAEADRESKRCVDGECAIRQRSEVEGEQRTTIDRCTACKEYCNEETNSEGQAENEPGVEEPGHPVP